MPRTQRCKSTCCKTGIHPIRSVARALARAACFRVSSQPPSHVCPFRMQSPLSCSLFHLPHLLAVPPSRQRDGVALLRAARHFELRRGPRRDGVSVPEDYLVDFPRIEPPNIVRRRDRVAYASRHVLVLAHAQRGRRAGRAAGHGPARQGHRGHRGGGARTSPASPSCDPTKRGPRVVDPPSQRQRRRGAGAADGGRGWGQVPGLPSLPCCVRDAQVRGRCAAAACRRRTSPRREGKARCAARTTTTATRDPRRGRWPRRLQKTRCCGRTWGRSRRKVCFAGRSGCRASRTQG